MAKGKENLEGKLKRKAYQMLSEKEDVEKYLGKYVALRFKKGFFDGEVISFGEDPVKVVEEAKKIGYTDPLIHYIPKAGEGLAHYVG